ncbi:MAG: class I SAM-dependent methyltransferase [Pseudomonadota bacterium]
MLKPKFDDRIEREREFHNTRFSEENRDAQGKYYAAIKDGSQAFDQRLMQLAKDSEVLEYGCGSYPMAHKVAGVAKAVTGIDISDVAVSLGDKKSATENINNTKFLVMNAEKMDFPDASFDMVFGRGIIHHLDIESSFSEIARVLRPNGTALFWEPLGHNRLFNSYRKMTPDARTIDEHPLLKKDMEIAKRYFADVELKFYGLFSLLSVPLRDSKLGDGILKITSAVDRAVFALPFIKWQAWYSLIEMRNPRHR